MNLTQVEQVELVLFVLAIIGLFTVTKWFYRLGIFLTNKWFGTTSQN